MKELQIKYFTDKIDRLGYIGGAYRSNWVDLHAAENVTMKAGEFRLIPLGVAMKLPEGYEALVAPRSSTFKIFGILQASGIGIIDGSYCGDHDQWFFPAIAMRDTEIHVNDRICQFRSQIFSKNMALTIIVYAEIDDMARENTNVYN